MARAPRLRPRLRVRRVDREPGRGRARLSTTAREAKESLWAHAAARIGLGSRALVYGLFAALVVIIAVRGHSPTGSDTDQSSSLQVLGRSRFGNVLLVALAVAVACYALWRFSEAWLGTADPGHSRVARVQAAIEGAFYLPFGYAALAVAFNDNSSAEQGRRYRGLSARFLRDVPGQALVALVGAIVFGVGTFFVVQGVRRSFLGHFDFDEMPGWATTLTRWTGVGGSFGRGLMFELAGALVVYAAITREPAKAGGIDSALDVLSSQAYGPALLGLAAAGFAAFAGFALCEAVWRRT